MGFRHVIVRYPRQRFTVVVLTNRDRPEPYPVALAIAKIFLPNADAGHAANSVSGPDSGAKPLPNGGRR